jgi:L-ascorbate metabolism protein UlaG (beta-lactamase superfamily)
MMKPAGSVIWLWLAMLTTTACSAPQVEVVAVANEGFLIRSARHAVLVDALFEATAPYPEFFQQGPSPALVAMMIAGEEPFFEIDIALVTHRHGDHFRAETALAFLQQHPETLLIGTQSVVDQLTSLEGYQAIAGRVSAPARTPGPCVRLDRRGVEVTVCPAWHSGGSEIANNIYLVDIDGFRFLHEGDADRSPATFSALPLGDGSLDLAFLHDWFVLNDGRAVVTDILRPRAIVLMHHRWTAAAETRDRVGELPANVASELPPVTVFGAELESTIFVPAAR